MLRQDDKKVEERPSWLNERAALPAVCSEHSWIPLRNGECSACKREEEEDDQR